MLAAGPGPRRVARAPLRMRHVATRPCTKLHALSLDAARLTLALARQVLPIIGTENNFDVLAVYESDNVNEALRKINRRKVVFGAKQHTVIVPEDVSGIVAVCYTYTLYTLHPKA